LFPSDDQEAVRTRFIEAYQEVLEEEGDASSEGGTDDDTNP
jgi:hypothetical protein